MAESFRIATFNLENLDDRPGLDPPLARRLELLRPQLLRLAADLLCLQEVNGQPRSTRRRRRLAALDKLLAGTAYADFARALTEGPHGPFDVQNLVILSRWPIQDRRQLRNDLVPPPVYQPVTETPPGPASPLAWDRPLLYVAVELAGGRLLHLVNLHLRATLASFIAGQKLDRFQWKTVGGWAEGFYLAALKRSGQALEARLLIESLFDAEPDGLIAVCGDLNAEAHEMPMRILRGDPDDTGNSRLAGRALVPVDQALPEARRFSVLHGGRRTMLDHILVSRPLMARLRSVELHNEGLGDELVDYATGGHSPESFHAPLVATFSLA
jgi:endonuclease/exonuclease/phosphatase family metal-dependent hydrolase